jgi:hypothetical protein
VPHIALAPVAPVIAALVAAGLLVAARGRRQSLSTVLWTIWAGLAGGAVATAGLSTELLTAGTGGVALSALGSLAGAAMMTTALAGSRTRGHLRAGPRAKGVTRTAGAEVPHEGAEGTSAAEGRGWWLSAAGLALGAVLLAWAGFGWIAVLVLLLSAAPAFNPFRLSLVGGLFAAASLLSAVEVVVGRVVLSPAGWIGKPVPTVAVAALAILPILARSRPSKHTWLRALRALGLVDLVVLAVACVAGLTWWSLFRHLDKAQSVSQLVRLGEDHLSHLLMLEATRTSGTSLGASTASTDVTTLFAGYFPGASIWQAAVGALSPGLSTIQAYIISTAILLSLLAGSATAAIGQVKRRLDAVAVLGTLAIGVVGTRATLAMYELGFPGQLLTACWFVTALTLLVRTRQTVRSRWIAATALAVLVVATWWTWSLAAPMLALPVGVLATQNVRAKGWLSDRMLARLLAGVLVLGALGGLLLHRRVLADLDTLTIEGGVFRSIPFWFPLLLSLGLPLAARMAGRHLPLPATALVLGTGAAMVGLTSWQVLRVGAATYYSYKLEYLLLALCWAVGAICLSVVAQRGVAGRTRRVQLVGAAAAVVLAIPLLQWPVESYRGWLTARAALGPDPAMACAVKAAAKAPDGSITIATGFGNALGNYLVTRAMDVTVGNNRSFPFWSPVLNAPDPATWPWANARSVFLISGPQATPAATAAITRAAAAAGVTTTAGGSC